MHCEQRRAQLQPPACSRLVHWHDSGRSNFSDWNFLLGTDVIRPSARVVPDPTAASGVAYHSTLLFKLSGEKYANYLQLLHAQLRLLQPQQARRLQQHASSTAHAILEPPAC